jgi:hypothetical protein
VRELRSRRPHSYDFEEVAKLLGLRESWADSGLRHITVVDLLSWARDPGTSNLYYEGALEHEPGTAWMARRGPLDPSSEEACVLWDLLRAMRSPSLELREQGAIALKAFGFTNGEIAQLLGLGGSRDVSRLLFGDQRTDRPGAVARVHRAMNNRPSAGEDRPVEATPESRHSGTTFGSEEQQ